MKKILQMLFSIKNEYEHKVLTILGIKIKFKGTKNKEEKCLNEIKILKSYIDAKTWDIIQNDNYNQRMILAVQKSLAIANIHQKTFPKYKNIYNGRTVVLCGAGPSLNYYEPIKDAVHVALTRAFLYEKVKFDYFFAADWPGIEPLKQEILDYKGNNCIKFLG